MKTSLNYTVYSLSKVISCLYWGTLVQFFLQLYESHMNKVQAVQQHNYAFKSVVKQEFRCIDIPHSCIPPSPFVVFHPVLL